MAGTSFRASAPAAAAAIIRKLCTATGRSGGLAGPGIAKPLYRRLSALGGAPPGSVANAMDEWVQEGKRVRPIQVVKYVRELRKYKRFSQALELMEWMERKGIRMTQSNQAILIDLLAKTSGIESAEEYFSNLPESAKDCLTYGALLSCYCREKMVEKSTKLYEKMKILGFDSTTLVYNNLASLYLQLDQPEKIPLLIDQMKAKNIPLDTFTRCILMNSFARLGDLDAVEKIVSQLEDEGGGTLSWPVYSNLASIYISAGLGDRADSALKKLEMAVDRKDRNSFHFLISSHTRIGNVSEVNRIWRLMKGIFPTTTNLSYLVVLQALDHLDDLVSMRECYEEWETLTKHRDIRLTNVVISLYLRKNMIREALTIWEDASRKGSEPNVRTFDLFVDYYLRNQEVDQAARCVLTAASRVKKEWRMDEERVSIFVNYFEGKNDLDGARKFHEALQKLGCVASVKPPDAATNFTSSYNDRIGGLWTRLPFARSLTTLQSLLKRITVTVISPIHSKILDALEAYSLAKQIRQKRSTAQAPSEDASAVFACISNAINVHWTTPSISIPAALSPPPETIPVIDVQKP